MTLRTAVRTLKKEGDFREEKLATLQKVKELVVDKEEQREKISDDMLALGYPDVYSRLAKRYFEIEGPSADTGTSNTADDDHDDGAETGEEECRQKTRWKILEIIYLTCSSSVL